MQGSKRDRRSERGVSFLLVVVGIFSILAMAMFAIDVVTMYAAKNEAQKAADAAALAGAQMFAISGSTSGSIVDQADMCSPGLNKNKMANKAAKAAAQANTVSGAAAQITNLTCIGSDSNPQIQVTIGRTNLPLFFARVFGRNTASVSATATAEAYNNSSAANTTKIQTGSVKPWLVENCTPGSSPCTANYFFAAGTNALKNPTNYVGGPLALVPYPTGPGAGVTYYAADSFAGVPANICPSTLQTSCSSVGSTNYIDDIACANQHQVACGDALPVSSINWPSGASAPNTVPGVECLIHASGVSTNQGQDVLTPAAGPGPPVTITKGSNNPNAGIATGNTISRSDSVVTVPVFNYTADPCNPGLGTCSGNETVIGFLQLGIKDVQTDGTIDTVIINAAGCNPSGAGTAVSGGGVSPVPVRLVQ